MKDYYQDWYNKWLRLFRQLCDKKESHSYKEKELIEKIKHHIWVIEWRLLCVKWYGEAAEKSNLWTDFNQSKRLPSEG